MPAPESSDIVKSHLERMRAEAVERDREVAAIKAATPEPILEDWPFQQWLDLFVKSGFAIVDEYATERWKHVQWLSNPPHPRHYKRMYKWTPQGKEACFRNMYSTPMAWAEDIRNGARHCVVCGRDCFYMKVSARSGKSRCVCMACGAKGHGLQDLQE